MSGFNPHAQEWLAVKAWAEREIAEATERLIEGDRPEARDHVDRGRIAALRELLALEPNADPDPTPSVLPMV